MIDRKAQASPQDIGESRRDASREVTGILPKAPWLRPRLVDHGDVRELTLGLSTGNIESGAPGTFRP